MSALSDLAINGGPKVRVDPWPERGQLGIEEKEAVDALFDESIATGRPFDYDGPAEESFCEEFAGFMGGGFVDAVSSGTSAIYVALKALDLEPFTEVIVGALTDSGGMMPVPLLNCIPVVADTAPGRFAPGPEEISAVISTLTNAIIVPHIAGEPADMEGIVSVASQHGIPVIEDCAQAHGARLNGKLVGSFGDLAAISTMSGKHMNTGGQGGVVYTKNERLYQAARRASDRGKPFFMPEGSTNQVASFNHNLNDLAAAIGRVQLKKLPGIVARRRDFVSKLTEGFHDNDLQAISITPSLPGAESSYWWWPLKVNTERLTCDVATFSEALLAEGIPANTIGWNLMPHKMEWFTSRRVFGSSDYPWASPLYKGDPDRQFPCPNATSAVADHVQLTVNESWGDDEVADILTAFKKVENAYLKGV
jgi:perosamine synthetase